MENEERNKKGLEERLYQALWDAYTSGDESIRIYQSGLVEFYMDSDYPEPCEGEIIFSINLKDLDDIPDENVLLDDYFSDKALEIADIIRDEIKDGYYFF